MAKNITIKVKAQDETSAPLNKVSGKINSLSKNIRQATSPLTNFGNSLKGLTSAIPGIGLVTAAVVGVTKAIQKAVGEMHEWESAWAEVEASAKRIDFAAKINSELKETGASLRRFTDDLSDTLRSTISGSDLSAAISGLTFDKTGAQIRQILSVATDLSAALGTDLNTAVTQLNNTFSGTTGQLGKLFPELKNLSKEALESGKAVELVGEKVKGMAEEMSNGVKGSLLRSKNLSSDLKEELGYYVKDFFTPIRDQISDIKKKWIDALSTRRNYKEALEAHRTGRATVDDYDVLINKLEADRRSEAGNKNLRESAGLGTGENEKAILELTQQINEYKRIQRELATAINAAVKSSPAITGTSAETTEQEETRAETVKLTKEQLQAQSALNKQMYEASLAEQQRQMDIQIEAQQRQSAFNEWKEAAQSIQQFKEGMKDAVLSSTGETGQLISVFTEGGWTTVIIQLVSMMLSKLSQVSGIINALYNIFTTAIEQLLKPLLEIIEPILNPILSIIQNIFGLVGSIIGALVPFINLLSPIIEFIGGVIYWLKTFFTSLFDYIRYGFTEMVNWIIRLYNFFAPKRKEKDYLSQNKSISEINNAFLSLWNGEFLDNYKAMLANNYTLETASSGLSGSATYNAARDIYVTINFNDSFVYSDKTTLAVELAREIRRAEKMNLV